HRRGYATEVGRALLDHAFRGPGAHRVFATTIEGNDAACRLLARLGMTREAALRKSTQHDGRWLDEYYYSVLDTDYADRQG
ncbi:GNAT family N-acetyltransferase, partial [Enterococcus faecium]